MPLEEIVSRLPTMQQQRVQVDETSGELIIPPGSAGYGAGEDRVRDEGGRIVVNGRLNMNTPFVLFAMMKMKGWERIEIRGEDDFCQTVALGTVGKELQLADDELREYVSAQMKGERTRQWLESSFVFLLVIIMGLAVPFLTISFLAGGVLPLLSEQPLYALPILLIIIVVLRLMARWITGQR